MADQLLQEADLNFQEKNFEKAENQYNLLIQKYISECREGIGDTKTYVSQALNNRGQIKYLRVDFDEAVEDYSEALNLTPYSTITLYNRGLVHYRLGRYTKAIADFKASLNIKPDFEDSIQALKTAEMEWNRNGNRDR